MSLTTNEYPSANIVVHESGVAMGKEAFDTGNPPEGAVSKTGVPISVNKPEVATPVEEVAPVPVAVDAPKADAPKDSK